MAQPDTSFEAARAMMVDSQVRPNKVTDRRVVDAMRRLPREEFVPAAAAARAYADEDVPLGNGRFLTEPMVIARLVQAADIRAGERALVVAAGSGYAAALLAACGAAVTALEDDPALLAVARSTLARLAPGVAVVAGPPAPGWPQSAPYDIVLIDGAVAEIPPALAAQLRPVTGRLLAVRAATGGVGQAVIGEATAAGLSLRPLFDAATPALPALRPVPGFVF